MKLHKQQGVALITAMLVVSLATILAVSLLDHLNFDTQRTANILRLDQTLLYNRAAVEVSRELLKLDLQQSNQFDDLNDISLFNTQMAAFPIEGGHIATEISDLQSCYNLNNLSPDASNADQQKERYRKLLGFIGIEAHLINSLTDSLIDWIDSNDQSLQNGAEYDYYLGMLPAYRSANQPLSSISELRLIRDYTQEVFDIIRPYVCVVSTLNTAININTASQEVIKSFPQLEEHAEKIIQEREDQSFDTMQSFNDFAKQTLDIKTLDQNGLQVYSEYFLLRSETTLGSHSSVLYSILYRNQSNGTTELIRQARGTL